VKDSRVERCTEPVRYWREIAMGTGIILEVGDVGWISKDFGGARGFTRKGIDLMPHCLTIIQASISFRRGPETCLPVMAMSLSVE